MFQGSTPPPPPTPARQDATLTVGNSSDDLDVRGIRRDDADVYGSVDNVEFANQGYVMIVNTSDGASIVFRMLESDWDYPLKIKIGSIEYSILQDQPALISMNSVTINGSTVDVTQLILPRSAISPYSDDFRDWWVSGDTIDFNIQRSDGTWLFAT